MSIEMDSIEMGKRQIKPQAYNDASKDEPKVCVVCMANKINTVCVPCGHRCICDECLTAIKKLGECPVCRQNTTKIIKTYNA